MSLIEQETYNGLKVCKRCGWSIISVDETNHDERCLNKGVWAKSAAPSLAKIGESATLLAQSIPNVDSTKLGYGTGKLTFNYDDKASITFRCEANNRFTVDHIWLLNDLSADAARDLVQTIKAWRDRRK